MMTKIVGIKACFSGQHDDLIDLEQLVEDTQQAVMDLDKKGYEVVAMVPVISTIAGMTFTQGIVVTANKNH